MDDWKKDRIGAALRGENPMVITRMKSGFAVMGDYQFFPGYCVLLACPEAGSLNELSAQERKQYLFDMTLVGDAIMAVMKPTRLNYATLMNDFHSLHTHIHPRYDWEAEKYKKGPVFLYPHEETFSKEAEYSEEKHGGIRNQIRAELERLMKENY